MTHDPRAGEWVWWIFAFDQALRAFELSFVIAHQEAQEPMGIDPDHFVGRQSEGAVLG